MTTSFILFYMTTSAAAGGSGRRIGNYCTAYRAGETAAGDIDLLPVLPADVLISQSLLRTLPDQQNVQRTKWGTGYNGSAYACKCRTQNRCGLYPPGQ